MIGAGAAGLVAARELRREGHVVTVLEQSGGVGGVWRFDARTEADALGLDEQRPPESRVHSSMYKQLRTNLPREIMSYSDFPVGEALGLARCRLGRADWHHARAVKPKRWKRGQSKSPEGWAHAGRQKGCS